MTKKLASEGIHKLQLSKVVQKDMGHDLGKMTFIFEVLDEEASSVLRTFNTPKDQRRILEFISSMAGKPIKEIPNDFESIKKTFLEGDLKSSQNKNYTNLIGNPKPIRKLSINTDSPVNDSKIGA